MAPFGVVALIFAYFFAISAWMPLAGDDYAYSVYLGLVPERAGGRIDSWWPIFEQTWIYYFDLHGRLLPNFLISAAMLMGKNFADLLVTLCFAAICYLSFVHAMGRRPRGLADAARLAAVFASIWLFSPDLAPPYIWKAGALNFSLSMALTLAFLLPFGRYWIHGENYPAWPRTRGGRALLCLIGLSAGLCVENHSLALSVALVLSFAAILYAKRALPGWYLAGACGYLFGAFVLLASPGGWSRLDNLGGEPETLRQLLTHGALFVDYVVLHMLPLWGAAAFLWWRSGTADAASRALFRRHFVFYAAIGLLIALVLIVFPIYIARAVAAATIFVTIGVAAGLRHEILRRPSALLSRVAVALIAVLFALVTLGDMADVARRHSVLSAEMNGYLSELARQSAAGIARPEIEAVRVRYDREIFMPLFHDVTRAPYLIYHGVAGVRLHHDGLMAAFAASAPFADAPKILQVDAGNLALLEIRRAAYDGESDLLYFVFSPAGEPCFDAATPWMDVRAITDADTLMDRFLVWAAPGAVKPLVLPRYGLYAVPYRMSGNLVVPGLFPKTETISELFLTLPSRALENGETCPLDAVRDAGVR